MGEFPKKLNRHTDKLQDIVRAQMIWQFKGLPFMKGRGSNPDKNGSAQFNKPDNEPN